MALAEIFIHVLTRLGDPWNLGIQELEGIDSHHCVHTGHLVRAETFPYDVIHEEHLRFRMIDEIMDVPWLEFVEDRHHHRAVGYSGQIADRPVDLVAGANRHLVPLVKEALFKSYVQFLDPSRYIPVTQAGTLVVGKRLPVPVLPEALFEQLVDRLELEFTHFFRFSLSNLNVLSLPS